MKYNNIEEMNCQKQNLLPHDAWLAGQPGRKGERQFVRPLSAFLPACLPANQSRVESQKWTRARHESMSCSQVKSKSKMLLAHPVLTVVGRISD
mmetsp:Transcript_43981/g.106643  ORF Transcript_43981/g.106643 Transcript_43981/m.106643 type:complete len:94 (+) Transcript_43981:50-331(+)